MPLIIVSGILIKLEDGGPFSILKKELAIKVKNLIFIN